MLKHIHAKKRSTWIRCIWWLRQEHKEILCCGFPRVSSALQISMQGLGPYFNVIKRTLSWAEGQRELLAFFYDTLNKLLSKAASGRTRKSWTPAVAVGTLCVGGVKNFKQPQEEETEAVASPCLGDFHGVGLQSHVPFHHLHWLPTACPSAQLPWTHTQGKDGFQSSAFPWPGS